MVVVLVGLWGRSDGVTLSALSTSEQCSVTAKADSCVIIFLQLWIFGNSE